MEKIAFGRTGGELNPHYKWFVIAMLWFISLFNYADRLAIVAVFPLLEKEFHLTPVQLGLLGSSFGLVYGLCSPLAGFIVDRVRRKAAILGGLYIWSVICMATAWSRTFVHLLFFRAAEGLGETFYYPASMSFISDYHGVSTRSRAMGFHQTAVYMGTIVGSSFAGLIGQHYGWRWSFIIFGGSGIVLGLILNRFLVEPQRGAADLAAMKPEPGAKAAGKVTLSEFMAILGRTPTALILMGAFFCANFVAVVLLTWMPKFLYDKFGMSLSMAGLTATLFVQVASMVGSAVGGWMADRWCRRTPGGRMIVQAIGVLGAAPFVILCTESRSVGVVIVALTAWGLFKGIYDANTFASVYDVVRPEARGTTVGFMNLMGWMAGGGSAPVIIGYIAQRRNLSTAIALSAGVYVAAAVLLLIGILIFVRRDVERLKADLTL